MACAQIGGEQETAHIHKGLEAYTYLQGCDFSQSSKIDIIVLTSSHEEESGLLVARNFRSAWISAVTRENCLSRLDPHVGATIRGEDSGFNSREDGESGQDEVDDGNGQTFSVKNPVCSECSNVVPELKIAVLDAGYLWIENFLEQLCGLVRTNSVMVVPVITNRMLCQPELMIRIYYLKLAFGFVPPKPYLIPAYVEPLRIPNYLFDELHGVKFFYMNRWGCQIPSMRRYGEVNLEKSLVNFFKEKLKTERVMCQHNSDVVS